MKAVALMIALFSVIAPDRLRAADEPAPASRRPADEANAMQCRRTMEVGSRIPKKVCRTKAEWAEIARESAELMRGSRNRASACGDAGPC